MVDDAEQRKALHERLLYALQGVVDPWLERTQGVASHEFVPLSAPVDFKGEHHVELA